MDRKTKTLRERVLEHLANLRLPVSAEELDHVLEAAEREPLSVLAAFDRLLGEQAARRRDRGITRRITAAKFAEHKTLEAFDWTFNKTINRTTSSSRPATSSADISTSSWSDSLASGRAI